MRNILSNLTKTEKSNKRSCGIQQYNCAGHPDELLSEGVRKLGGELVMKCVDELDFTKNCLFLAFFVPGLRFFRYLETEAQKWMTENIYQALYQ